jgi:hypothetical protein
VFPCDRSDGLYRRLGKVRDIWSSPAGQLYLPEHIVLAKVIASLDRLSGGVESIISPYLLKVAPASLNAYHAARVSEVVQLLPIPADEAKLPDVLEQMARDWVEPAARLG